MGTTITEGLALGLLKGQNDEESVRKATDDLLTGKVAKGVGGQVEIDQDWVTIRHKGALGFMNHGLPGEKRVPIANITAVTIKEPGLSNGYIHFTILGGIDRQRGGVFDAAKDENSVMFTRRHLAEFVAIKAHVEARMVRGAMGPSAPPTTTRLEQLKQLGELRDSGVLTAEEFELEKQKLLSGS